MKKYYIVLLTLLLACASCRQEVLTPEGSEVIDPSRLRFELSIELPGSTKGVKSGWENGDVVFLFINGNTSGYVAASYNNPRWNTDYRGTLTIDALGASGTLSAVYLPYGYNAAASYADSKWTFDGGTDTYYLYAENVAYTVSTVDEEKILYATVTLQRAGYVQFFIPCPSASGTIQLACNALRPAGFGSLSSDGTVTGRTDGTAGSWMNGHPDTLGAEEGYYVSGIPAESPGQDYYFVLHKTDDSYADYYKHRTAIAASGAYELPEYNNWHTVNNTSFVYVAGARWKQMNAGASLPWASGSAYAWSGVTGAYDNAAEQLPGNSHWTDLLDGSKASRIPMHIGDGDGYLFVSASSAANYIFLPRSTASNASYWTASGGSGVYLWTPTDDATPEVRTSATPSEAYVRTIGKNWFRIKAKQNGTTMTFKYTDGSVQFSLNYGGTWDPYDGREFHLSKDEEVCFKGTRADCDCNGETQLFYADKPCWIAGDITCLLADPTSLATNAFRSAFSNEDINDNNYNPAAVTFVDIDSRDPLILPAFTGNNCYREMFRACTSLTSIPDLPATTVAEGCYFNMFRKCTGLTKADITLPAMELAPDCYRELFRDCSNLTSIPVFPAPILVDRCYQQMLSGCTSLTSITCLATDISATSCLQNWVQGINTTGTFHKASSMSSWVKGTNVPSKWTITDYTPSE